jgi:hypothetical protein
MAGLVPAIHVCLLRKKEDVDHRHRRLIKRRSSNGYAR